MWTVIIIGIFWVFVLLVSYLIMYLHDNKPERLTQIVTLLAIFMAFGWLHYIFQVPRDLRAGILTRVEGTVASGNVALEMINEFCDKFEKRTDQNAERIKMFEMYVLGEISGEDYLGFLNGEKKIDL